MQHCTAVGGNPNIHHWAWDVSPDGRQRASLRILGTFFQEMEAGPKCPVFIGSWSRTACGNAPVTVCPIGGEPCDLTKDIFSAEILGTYHAYHIHPDLQEAQMAHLTCLLSLQPPPQSYRRSAWAGNGNGAVAVGCCTLRFPRVFPRPVTPHLLC